MAGRHLQNVVNNTVHQVSAQRINIRSILWHNDDVAARYLQMFNVASGDVTLGTTTPDLVMQLNADSADTFPLHDMEFATAFSYAVTTTATGNTGGTSSWIAVSYI